MVNNFLTIEPRSCSEYVLYGTCAAKWYYTYRARRVTTAPRGPARPIGTAFHAAAQAAMTEAIATPAEWFDVMVESWRGQGREMNDPASMRTLAALASYGAGFLAQERPWDKVLSTEEVLERRGVNPKWGYQTAFYLRGKMDAIVERRGRPWLLEWKTLAPSTPVGVYLRGFKRSLQAGLYPWLAETKYGEIPGWLLIVVRKFPQHDKSGNERTWEQAVEVVELPIGPLLRAGALKEARSIDRSILDNRVKDKRIAQTGRVTGQCTGQHGNSLCEYIDVCDGTASLDDPLLFTDARPNERYEDGAKGDTE